MTETGKLTVQQGADGSPADVRPSDVRLGSIWNGLQQVDLRPFAHFPDWITAIRDTHRLTEALDAAVPEFSADPETRGISWQLKDISVSHIRFKNGILSALYKLTVHKPDEAADTIIDLQGKIFPPGKLSTQSGVRGSPNRSSRGQMSARITGRLGRNDWHAVLPALDLELEPRQPDIPLAALGFLTDPEKSRTFLEENLRAHYPDIQIKACSPKVVRYNLGDRCTVVYHLEYEPRTGLDHEWPQMVVAKTYHGNAGKNAFESMSALWDSPLGPASAGTAGIVKIAEPLAYLPEHRVLIQGPVREEKTLEALLEETVKYRSPKRIDEFNHYMRLTAQGLADLHNSGVKLGKVWSWKDQLNVAQKEMDHLEAVLPELRHASAPFFDRLNQLAEQIPPDPLVPTHGTFRTPQVLLYKGEIGFIDFDSFRQSEPADDLALFLGEMFNFGLTPQDIEHRQARRPLERHIFEERFDFLMTAHDDFLAEYQRRLRDASRPQDGMHPRDAGRPGVSYQRVALWEALDMFMFILHDLQKVKMGDLESSVDLLQRFLQVTSPKI